MRYQLGPQNAGAVTGPLRDQAEERVIDLLGRAKGFAEACRWAAGVIATASAVLVVAPAAEAGTVPSGFHDKVVFWD